MIVFYHENPALSVGCFKSGTWSVDNLDISALAGPAGSLVHLVVNTPDDSGKYLRDICLERQPLEVPPSDTELESTSSTPAPVQVPVPFATTQQKIQA